MMRRRPYLLLSAGLVAVGALATASVVRFAPRLVWNASASAPIGLYWIDLRAPKVGALVLVDPSVDVEDFMVTRGYLPKGVPVLKRVAAASGAEICRFGSSIFIDKHRVAEALSVDSLGRPLPLWRGCFSLSARQVLLLNAPKNSLDGRYFGATEIDAVIGVASPVWVRKDGA